MKISQETTHKIAMAIEDILKKSKEFQDFIKSPDYDYYQKDAVVISFNIKRESNESGGIDFKIYSQMHDATGFKSLEEYHGLNPV